jgi:hypothetical protein
VGCSACYEPAPAPTRQAGSASQPACDDEGVGGGWQRHRIVSLRRRRRIRM